MEIFEKIKKLRVAADISQAELADALGIKRPNYNKKELGKVKFSADEYLNAISFLRDKVPPEIFESVVNPQQEIVRAEVHEPATIWDGDAMDNEERRWYQRQIDELRAEIKDLKRKLEGKKVDQKDETLL